jgi:hypothetical protein
VAIVKVYVQEVKQTRVLQAKRNQTATSSEDTRRCRGGECAQDEEHVQWAHVEKKKTELRKEKVPSFPVGNSESSSVQNK